jgi:5'-3' exonuclease
MNDIESMFGLDRERLINLAMLTGSDYTQGVHGIGPGTYKTNAKPKNMCVLCLCVVN